MGTIAATGGHGGDGARRFGSALGPCASRLFVGLAESGVIRDGVGISAGLPAISLDRRPWLRPGGSAAPDLPVDPGAGGHDGGVESGRRAAVGPHRPPAKSIAMAGSALQGLGLWLIAVSNSYTTFLFGVALTGMGHGVYEGVDLALVTEVLPDRERHAAKDLGLLNITNTLPQVIAPLAAPAILAFSRGDYTLLFLVAGAVPLMGAALLSPLKSVR